MERSPYKFRRSGIIFRVFLAVVCGFFATEPAEAQIFKRDGGLFNRDPKAPKAQTADEIGVPTPVTGRVTAKKGFEITFEIKAETKTPGAAVEFLIRTFPSAGKIVSMVNKPNERNKAIVTYYADPTTGASADAFAFAVRYRGGRYSSAMRYDIDLEGGTDGNSAAAIQVPESVDFGKVSVGDEAVREIKVVNIGEGSYEQVILLTPPWYLIEPASGKLGLAGNSAANLKVAFRPDLTGETSYFLSLTRSKEGTMKLFGSGSEPFTLSAEAIKLELDPSSGERTGKVELVNPGEKPIQVKAQGSPRLESGILERYLIAPGQPKEIPIRLADTDTAPFDGMVQFQMDNGYSKYVKVIAPVVPGKLEVDIPDAITDEVLNFGKVEAGRSIEKKISLRNVGGVSVPLEFHIPTPFQLLNDPGPQLGPRAEVSISLGLFPGAGQKGSVDVTMNVFGGEQTLPIRLLGNVLPGSGTNSAAGGSNSALTAKRFRFGAPGGSGGGVSSSPAVPENAPQVVKIPDSEPTANRAAAARDQKWRESLSAAERAGLQTPFGYLARPVVDWKINQALRRPEDLTIIEKDSNSLTIGWTAPKGTAPFSFVVEMRGLYANPEKGNLPENVWIPYSNVEFERIDRLVKAKVKGLNPYSSYEMRVLMIDDRNESSPPSEVLIGDTEAPMDWTYIYLVLGILFAIGLVFAIIKIILARRPEVYQSKYAEL
ncbi:fibronectin type III domain-containing protein [Verrucomicrobiales bacterium BCK34]|nr:fibronectin type III domain-containing protein [Verrucomicrobiales bacterium BCK34]